MHHSLLEGAGLLTPLCQTRQLLIHVAKHLGDGGLFWAGTWGGSTTEGTWDDDRYTPKRFYSIRDDELMRSLYEPHFEVLSFDTFDPMPDIDWHYQSALLRSA